MLVLDASATVDLLLRNPSGERVRERIRREELFSVVHLDAEVFSALARLERDGKLDVAQVRVRLEMLGALELQRLPITTQLLTAAWELRDTVAARDALYVAAGRGLGSRLLTTDRRFARAVPGLAVPLDVQDGEG